MNRARAKEACAERELQSAESRRSRGGKVLLSYEAAMAIIGIDLQLNSLPASGAANVSVPMVGRERNVLRLKLLSFERRLDAPCPFVGVGGMSSILASLSTMVRLAVGD